ncbi:MAG: ABC transporter ATP-binding protein [Anaerolineales bacterium]
MTQFFNLFASKFRQGQAQFPYLLRALLLVWSAARGWMLAWLVLLIIQGILPVAIVYLTRILVDSLVAVVEAGGSRESISPLLFSVALMAIVMLLKELLSSLSNYIRTVQSERVTDYISDLIHRKSISVDLAFYDSPDYYDQLHRAMQDAGYRPLSLLESSGSLLQNSITLFAMAAVLIPYSWWLPLALLVSTIPAFYVVFHHRMRLYRWRLETTHHERRSWYLKSILTMRGTAAELRLFHLGDHFRIAYKNLRHRLRDEQLKLTRDQGLSELAAGTIALLITGIAMAWMLWQVVLGEYSLGDLALFYSAFNQGQSLMRSLLGQMGEIYSNSLFLGDLFAFLELKPKVVDPQSPIPTPVTLTKSIRFENVSFRYPDSERLVVRDFNLSIPAGQIVAIVGPNGAGKSTLAKLLCRFYDPQEGSITFDGCDLRDISVEDLRHRITVLFQEPVQYYATVAENIAYGDLASKPGETEIKTAANAAGADSIIDRLPDNYDTLLGKWFKGGTDLSVGEWQRIALARAFLRQAPIIVLDEPTSAMDPWAEADWLRRFRELARNRTTIIITHRFTTAAFADVVHVMDDGKIVESGRHDELVAEGGRYARSWMDQMQKWIGSSQTENH